jgi:phosphoglycolate phosphatase
VNISPTTVIFDLDGTLIDTAPDLTGALNRVLAEEGLPPVNQAETRRMVGRGARVLIESALNATGAPPDQGRVSRLLGRYLAHYQAHIADESVPFEGVRETLEALRDEGARLGICTNKSFALSEKLLDALDLRRYFAAVVGGDTLEVHKPDPAHLLEAIRRTGGQRTGAIMIGDSGPDFHAARNAGVPVILVSFGYGDEPAESFGADALVHHYDEMLPAVRGLAAMAFP